MTNLEEQNQRIQAMIVKLTKTKEEMDECIRKVQEQIRSLKRLLEPLHQVCPGCCSVPTNWYWHCGIEDKESRHDVMCTQCGREFMTALHPYNPKRCLPNDPPRVPGKLGE
jgi:hypothetical protein